ncbi:PilN domain-containing protein [Desulfonatronum parangueonense]
MQRINLYQDDLKEARILLPARQMLMIAGLAVAGMAATCWWMQTLPEKPRAEANALQAEADKLDQTVRQLQEQVSRKAPNEALIRQVETLQNRLRGIRQLRQAAIPPPSMAMFSSYLEGLGRQSRDGIWLTEIRIGNQGRSFLLSGGVFDPSLIPEYIQALEAEQIYAGLFFDNLTVTRVEGDHPHLKFTIATNCLPDEQC